MKEKVEPSNFKSHEDLPEEKKEEKSMTEGQKEMSKIRENNPEQKEKLMPLLIIYRENDFLNEHAPKMAKIWQTLGREVNMQSFPKEADEDEIKNWYKNHKDTLTNIEIISDWSASAPYEIQEDLKKQGIKINEGIDELFEKIIENAILGKTAKELKKQHEKYGEYIDTSSPENLKKWFSTVIKKILENPENMPKMVYIFLDTILDHTHLIDRKEIEKIKNGPRDIRENTERQIAEKIKNYILEGGIPSDKIVVADKEIYGNYSWELDDDLIKEADKLGNWIIMDRHAAGRIGFPKITSAKNLQLPEDTFYQIAKNEGLLKVTDEEFNEALEEFLKNIYENTK